MGVRGYEDEKDGNYNGILLEVHIGIVSARQGTESDCTWWRGLGGH